MKCTTCDHGEEQHHPGMGCSALRLLGVDELGSSFEACGCGVFLPPVARGFGVSADQVLALMTPEDLRAFRRDYVVYGSASARVTRDADTGDVVSVEHVDAQVVALEPDAEKRS